MTSSMFFTASHLVLMATSCVVLYFARRQQKRTEAFFKACDREVKERVEEIFTNGYVRGVAAERARKNPAGSAADKRMEN